MLSLRRMKKNLSITICPSLDIWKDFIDTFAFWAITWGGDSKILLKQLHCIYQNWCARIFQISVTLRKFSRNEMCISSHITMYIKLLHLMDHAQNYIFTNDASSSSSFDDTHIGIMHMNHSYDFFHFFWVLHDRSLHSCPSLHVGRIMPVTKLLMHLYVYEETPVPFFNFPYFRIRITIMLLSKNYYPALIRDNFTYQHQCLSYQKMRKTLKMTETSKKLFVNCYFHKIVENYFFQVATSKFHDF